MVIHDYPMVNHEYQMVDKSSGGDDNPLQRPQWWKWPAPIRRRETRVSETKPLQQSKGWSELLMNYYFFTTVSGAGTVLSVKLFRSMNANLVENELIAGFEWNLENPNQIDLTWFDRI